MTPGRKIAKKKPPRKKVSPKQTKASAVPGKKKKNSDYIKPYMWKKGQSGNPKGRPPSAKTLSTTMRHMMEEPAERIPLIKAKCEAMGMDPKKTTVGATLAASVICEGTMGEAAFMKEAFNRIEGKVADKLELPDLPTMMFNIVKSPAKKKKKKA